MMDMYDLKVIIVLILTIIIISSVSVIGFYKQEEYIKQLEQSLTEQIQETEVYRGILETYQTEGIINE